MPRSFLVKKVKIDDFPAGLDAPYGRTRADFGSRLHDKGKYRGGGGGLRTGAGRIPPRRPPRPAEPSGAEGSRTGPEQNRTGPE